MSIRIDRGRGEEIFPVRIAERGDLRQAVDVVNRAYSRVPYLNGERTNLQFLETAIADPKNRLYVCLTPEQTVCGTILLELDPPSESAELGLFAVAEGYKGLGTSFMQHVEKEAFQQVSTLVLRVIKVTQERLLAFYEGRGYRLNPQRTEPFPSDLMERYIKPEYRDQVFFSFMTKTR